MITDKNVKFKYDNGKLSDIAPTLLTLMEYGVPVENMTNFDALSDEFAECYEGCKG